MANPLSQFWSATMAAVTAFRQSYMGNDFNKGDYVTWEARQTRYRLLWSLYENSAYQNLHLWGQKYKSDYGLYEFIRAIYNPSYRLGEFWKLHLLGGKLDVVDGQATDRGALPILTNNDALRAPIATLWRWSNWQTRKDALALWTTVMGDGAIKIIDDPERKKAYLKLVHPTTLKEVWTDDWGNVKEYEIEEWRADPRKPDSPIKVRYTETARRSGSSVVYKTYLDGRLYAWDRTNGATWDVAYTFTPMVVLQHNDVGLDWGMSELLPGLPKFREVDDLASKLSDQVRKTVDAAWLMAGVKPSDRNEPNLRTDRSSSRDVVNQPRDQSGRQKIPMYWSGPDAKAQPLVAPLDITGVTNYILSILQGIEADYPEMTADKNNATGDISGKALRINRAPAENKVQQRRPNYDDAIVRAHQMAIAIGGMRVYPGFEGFSLNSYEAGDLEHQIADRPVFDKDPLDDLERDTAFWMAASKAKDAGVPLTVFLRHAGEAAGWDEAKIVELENSPEFQMRMEAMKLSVEAARLQSPPTSKGNAQNGQDD